MIRRLAAGSLALYLAALAVNRLQVVVRGPSMEPALWAGDRLVAVWLPRRVLRLVRPGDVVVVADPADPDHRVVKRVHAVLDGRIDVRGDAPDRSTDSRTWGSLPLTSVRRLALRRWPDVRTPLWRDPTPYGAPGQPGRRATTSSSGSSSPTSPGSRAP